MSITKHHNAEYDASAPAGIPKAVGDRYYAQDLFRNFHYLLDRLGLTIGDISDGQSGFIVNGGIVTQEAPVGDKEIAITACVAYIKYQIQVPNSAGIPPTTANEDIEYIRVNCPSLTDVDASGATYDGGTTNYVKLSFTDLDGLSRSRAKKAGSYNFDQSPSYTITIDSVAPTAYEITLARFTAVVGGTMTFDTTGRTEFLEVLVLLNDMNFYSKGICEFDITYTGDDINTVTYKRGATTIAVATYTYSGDNIDKVEMTIGEIKFRKDYTYDGSDNLTDIDITRI